MYLQSFLQPCQTEAHDQRRCLQPLLLSADGIACEHESEGNDGANTQAQGARRELEVEEYQQGGRESLRDETCARGGGNPLLVLLPILLVLLLLVGRLQALEETVTPAVQERIRVVLRARL
eukprot:758358-Hanusia_phi.AAC.1